MVRKDSGLRIRVDAELREAFVRACRARNEVASEVLREFMRAYADKQQAGQADLFQNSTQENET